MPTIKRPTVEVTLLQGDDSIKAEELLAKVRFAADALAAETVEAERRARTRALSNLRMGEAVEPEPEPDQSDLDDAMADYNEFMDGAVERGETITVTALRGKDYRAILADHLPREGNARDQQDGLNWDTIGDDLMPPSVADQFMSPAERDEFIEDLTIANQRRLTAACVHANQGGGVDPKARLSLQHDRTSDETSESPARLG